MSQTLGGGDQDDGARRDGCERDGCERDGEQSSGLQGSSSSLDDACAGSRSTSDQGEVTHVPEVMAGWLHLS